MNKITLLCWSAFCCVGLSACSNWSASNLFSHYTAQNQTAYQHLRKGQYSDSLESMNEIGGKILDNFEQGRLKILVGDYPDARQALNISDKAVEKQQRKATVSLSDTASNLAALVVNDNMTDYVPADYELGFLHLYLALTYIKANQLEGAMVEFRRANQVQEKAKKLREKTLLKEQSSLKEQGVTPNIGAVLARYPDAGNTLKAVQNGYLFYLSALMYEASGDLNDAYVDYRRALAVAPDNMTVATSAMRCAKKLSIWQDFNALQKRYGKLASLKPKQARVIVVQEQGVVDLMRSWDLSLPIWGAQGKMNIYSLALPYYPQEVPSSFDAPTLNAYTMSGQELSDVNLMARQQLRERILATITRQVLRFVVKNEIRQEASKDNDIVNLVFNVWNTLTEQPDTRSWMTLPANIYTATQDVEAGEQTLTIGSRNYHFSVSAMETVLVWISRQGPNSVVWHKQLGKL